MVEMHRNAKSYFFISQYIVYSSRAALSESENKRRHPHGGADFALQSLVNSRALYSSHFTSEKRIDKDPYN